MPRLEQYKDVIKEKIEELESFVDNYEDVQDEKGGAIFIVSRKYEDKNEAEVDLAKLEQILRKLNSLRY